MQERNLAQEDKCSRKREGITYGLPPFSSLPVVLSLIDIASLQRGTSKVRGDYRVSVLFSDRESYLYLNIYHRTGNGVIVATYRLLPLTLWVVLICVISKWVEAQGR